MNNQVPSKPTINTTIMNTALIHILRPCRRLTLLLAAGLGLCGQFIAQAASPPVFTPTSCVATQRAGTKLVDVTYTVTDSAPSVNVFAVVSSDGGATWTVPATTFTNGIPGTTAYGPGVTPGSVKWFVWNAGADWGGQYSTSCKVRVIACDNGMVLIPAGSYLRGNYVASQGSGDSDITDAPTNSVFVNAFLIDSNLVTGSLWNYVIANSPGYSYTHAGSFKAPNHPVQTIDWFDAVKWCNDRSTLEGTTPVYYTDATCSTLYCFGEPSVIYMKGTTNGYRLPTEAEWEKAARGGVSGHRFPWGTDIIAEASANYQSAANPPTYDWGPTGYNPTGIIGGSPYTSPVGSFVVNGYGLFDMAGNVNEWCGDWYLNTYYTSGQTNPTGPTTGTSRVLRGGSWSGNVAVVRCANRGISVPGNADYTVGFRCVRGF